MEVGRPCYIVGDYCKVLWRAQGDASQFEAGSTVHAAVRLVDGRIRVESISPEEQRRAEIETKLAKKAQELGMSIEELLEQLI